jgi:outer membrane protein OmpA-like peptidoglycan-associated protein
MTSLFGLATSLIMGVLGSIIHGRHLDADGLGALLRSERDKAKSALPPSVAAAFPEVPSVRTEVPSVRAQVPVRPVTQGRSTRLWPLLLLIPLAIIVGRALRHASMPPAPSPGAGLGVGVSPTTPEAPPAVLPGGAIGSEMSAFLASPGGEASKRFVFDDLNFEVATANLMPHALGTLDSVAQVLEAHPSASLLVEGHTDATGVPADNQRLSQARADAVKSALVARGVPADRIHTVGYGQDRPIASNDTAEGRAKNRRTELVVTR